MTTKRTKLTKRNAGARSLMVVQNTGRKSVPTKLTALAVETVFSLARAGLREQSIAARISIDATTFANCKKNQPEIQAAFDAGRAELEEEIAGLLLTSAREGQLSAQIFLAKNHNGFSDQGIRGEQAQKVEIRINIPAPMSTAEFEELVNATKVIDVTPKPSVDR
jgi:hypothetical protein